jgi:hypothetical protein
VNVQKEPVHAVLLSYKLQHLYKRRRVISKFTSNQRSAAAMSK